MEEELQWIKSIVAGDIGPFQQLYDRHSSKLFALCLQFTRNREDAEEQLQEIFLRILDKIHLFRGDSQFGTWAYRLAFNYLANFKKSHARRTERELGGIEIDQADAKGPVLNALVIQEAIAQLPDGCRIIFVLHDQLGLGHEEIADLLACSSSNSRAQLSRARQVLRECLKDVKKEMEHAAI